MAGKLDPNATGNYNSVVGHVKNTERSQWMLRCIVQRSHQLSAESVATEQKKYDLLISSRAVHTELHVVVLHGQAATSKPYISQSSANAGLT